MHCQRFARDIDVKHRLFLILCIVFVAGCAELGYYRQSVLGHLAITHSARPITALLAEPAMDETLRMKLQTIARAREFATHTLLLPANNSYREFVDLQRGYALQNLYAAEEFSTELKRWCYPVIGCANYRGYFDEDMLLAHDKRLREHGYDTHIGQVTAYSTLGWFDDPVLNTFTDLPNYRMVGLIFHELAHQRLYIKDDTAFNESFATAVERAGMTRYYQGASNSRELDNYHRYLERRQVVAELAAGTRRALAELYALPLAPPDKRARKRELLLQLDAQYLALAGPPDKPPAHAGEPRFNNARLGLFAVYTTHVTAFLNLLDFHSGDFSAFYAAVSTIAGLDAADRARCLQQWAAEGRSHRETTEDACAGRSD